MATLEERLNAIEARLSKLETQSNFKAPLPKAQPAKSIP
jgi:BMFP domain-containing protein YqiC